MPIHAYMYAVIGCLYLDAAFASHLKRELIARNRERALGGVHVVIAVLMVLHP